MKLSKFSAFGIVLVGGIQFAHAQAGGENLYFAQMNTQTGASSTVLNGYFAAEEIPIQGVSNDAATGTVTRPNATVDTLTSAPINGTLFQYLTFLNSVQLSNSSSLYTNLASFNSDWGLGGYTFAGTLVSSAPYSTTVHNTATNWTATAPTVTDYATLKHGVNPGQGFTFNFTPFTPTAFGFGGTNVSLWDLTTGTLYKEWGVAANVSDVTISGFDPGHSYQLVIADGNFSYDHSASPIGQVWYDNVTAVDFQATPEPAPFAVVGLGVLGLLIRRRSRR